MASVFQTFSRFSVLEQEESEDHEPSTSTQKKNSNAEKNAKKKARKKKKAAENAATNEVDMIL